MATRKKLVAKRGAARLRYTTKELSLETWTDFATLFSKKGGWDHCWCMHFQRPCRLPQSEWLATRAERSVRNRQQKKELVGRGRAHGILVYAGKEPVGWCQFGAKDELPRIDNSRIYRKAAGRLEEGDDIRWRITCFVVDKEHRRQGVARAALRAALAAMRERGGGLVEGYPIARWETRAFGNESTCGTKSMFEKAGFRVVAGLSNTRFSSHVLMRKKV
jgi:ribosomal protein S18 acetylase RimI-like enzyme